VRFMYQIDDLQTICLRHRRLAGSTQKCEALLLRDRVCGHGGFRIGSSSGNAIILLRHNYKCTEHRGSVGQCADVHLYHINFVLSINNCDAFHRLGLTYNSLYGV